VERRWLSAGHAYIRAISSYWGESLSCREDSLSLRDKTVGPTAGQAGAQGCILTPPAGYLLAYQRLPIRRGSVVLFVIGCVEARTPFCHRGLETRGEFIRDMYRVIAKPWLVLLNDLNRRWHVVSRSIKLGFSSFNHEMLTEITVGGLCEEVRSKTIEFLRGRICAICTRTHPAITDSDSQLIPWQSPDVFALPVTP
jgi:hypothetical protein